MVAKNINYDANLGGNEIQNGVIQNLSTAPNNPKEGQFYYNTTDKTLYVYANGAWVDALSQGCIYIEGTGIDITNDVISVDTSIIAQKSEIPTTASDVGALANTTKYGASIAFSVNTSTYVLTAQLKDQDGNNLGTAQTVDLPLESVVVSGSYDSTNQKIVLTLVNGNTIDVPVGGLISGLQSEINSSNKLDADLVDDSTSTNKFVSSAEKTRIANSARVLTVNNPALTATSGVVTWSITNTLASADVIVQIRNISTNTVEDFVIKPTANTITVQMNASANIAADTYRAVITG